VRDRHRGGGGAHPLHPRGRRGSLQPRLHLPQGGGAAGRPRGPGPPAAPAAPARVGLGGGGLGRSAGRGGRASGRDPGRARPGGGGRLPGQPHRPQLRLHPLQPAPAAQPGHAQPLLGHVRRPAPADAGRAPHVRPPAPAAHTGPGPHELLPGLRRQPAGLERQPDDGAGRRAPPQGDARARGPAGGGGSTADGDGGHGRSARPHPAGHRRPAAARVAAHRVHGGAPASGAVGAVHGRPGGRGAGRVALPARAGGRGHRRSRAGHPRAGP
jgi:hypothetical protein